MASTVRSAFTEFAARLEPTGTQRSDAATKHSGVRDCLNSTLFVDTAFLIGSYVRWTLIRPPDDIDLLVVLDYSKHGADYYIAFNGAQSALQRFHTLLKTCYPYTPIRKDHPAVYLNFSTYGFDVIPAFRRNGGGYVIPSRFGSGWVTTDPQKHAERTTAMNKATGNYFVPLVKMFKSWNRSHFNRLTGFHLEMAMADAWPRASSLSYPYTSQLITYMSYAQAAAALFTALANQLSYSTPDPAGLSPNIDEYLAYEDRTRTRQRLETAAVEAQIAIRHEERGDHYSAITKWRSIFDDLFPAYS